MAWRYVWRNYYPSGSTPSAGGEDNSVAESYSYGGADLKQTVHGRLPNCLSGMGFFGAAVESYTTSKLDLPLEIYTCNLSSPRQYNFIIKDANCFESKKMIRTAGIAESRFRLQFTLKGKLIWDVKYSFVDSIKKIHSRTILTLIKISCMIVKVVNSTGDRSDDDWSWSCLEHNGQKESRSNHPMQRSVYLLYLRILLLNLSWNSF